MPQPVISVIIPTLDEAENLPGLLEDLGKQLDLSMEIIVSDGGSTDNSRQIAEESGARCIISQKGRGRQMNAGAAEARGEFLFFLHADSRIHDPELLKRAVTALRWEVGTRQNPNTAGHFRLGFIRATNRNSMAYRYLEEKSAFNRVNTTNGDQGVLISGDFFQRLGGFDERLPFLEDQRLSDKIRTRGVWITLPGLLHTSARRFEAEGFHRRYILMSMMMGLYAVGEETFFIRSPGIYRSQQKTGKLFLWPFFSLIWSLIRNDWGVVGSIRTFYLLGQYIRQNSWQMFFFLDLLFRPLLGDGPYPFLNFHDRYFAPCTDFRLFNALVGMLCFIWFMTILAPFYWLMDHGEQNRDNIKPTKSI